MNGIYSHEFIVSIAFQEHHTLQGYIFWIETKEKIYFKSALEMILIIYEKLEITKLNSVDWLI